MNHQTVSGQTGSHTSSRRSSLGLSRCWAALALCIAAIVSVSSAQAQVQPIVASSQVPLTTVGGVQAGPAVVDSCGNIYVNEYGQIVQFAAGTGAQTIIAKNTNGYGGPNGIAIDSTKTNLYFPLASQWYGSAFSQVNVSTCTPGGTTTFGNNAGNFNSYYYGTAGSIAVDGYGDVFFVPTAAAANILEEVCTTAPKTPCTAPPAATSATFPLTKWANSITSLAADAVGNVYFTDGSANVYLLAVSSSGYTAAPTPIGSGFGQPVGLTIDGQGNLYIADGKNSVLYEIPYESKGLNPADQFQVLQNTSFVFAPAVDPSQNIYIANYSGNLFEEVIGAAKLPSTNVAATSASTTVNFVFNAATTPATISAYSGTAISTVFTPGTSGCTAGTTYAAGKSCSVAVTFTPSAVGTQSGALVLASSSGAALSTTALTGIGLGAAATIDPGTLNPYTGTFKTPEGAAIGPLGALYVADAALNTITKFAAGSTTGTLISTGTLTLSGPSSVAVDGLGDIFISDTGNNRIVEVPVVAGALSSASAAALTLSVKSPGGLAFDGLGNLYIADTGNNRLLFVPNHNGSLLLTAAQTYGTGFNAPLAVAVDSARNVFVADSGNNAVQELPGPIGSLAQLKVATALSGPSGLATDAAGDLYVVDKGNAAVLKYPNYSGTLGNKTIVGSGIAAPYGVTIDPAGNLYVTDSTNAIVNQIARVQTAVNFGGWNVNTTSTPLTATVGNSGNLALNFPTPSYTTSGATTAGFKVTTDGCATAATLATGASCNMTATFSPTAIALNNEEFLTFSSNAVNGTAKLGLIGTGANITPSTLTLTLTSPAAGVTIKAGAAVAFSATVGTGSNSAVPGGSVTFFVNGTQVGTTKVTNGSAALSLPNGLPGGSVVITANYSGDSLNYSGSSASLTLTVVALPDTLSLVITTPYTNPQSVNDVSTNPAGPAVPLIATLVPSATIIPGGTVSFYSGTAANPTLLGLASVINAGGGVYTATLNETALRAGKTNIVENNSTVSTYNIFAVYSGDTNYGPSTSNSVPLAVVAPPVTLPACATAATPTCQVNTTGAFFTITPSNPSMTITSTGLSGQGSGSVALAINSYGGWQGVVNFTCSNLPQYATCSPYPGAPVVNFSTPTASVLPTPVTFIINTNVPPLVPTANGFVWWIAGLLGFALVLARRRLKGRGLNALTLVASALLLVASLGGVTACSSGNFNKTVTPTGLTNVLVTVSAAQGVATTTNTQKPDSNVGSFTISVYVQ